MSNYNRSDQNNNDSSTYGIEKFEGSFEKEEGGCSILVNSTINSIRNMDAAGMYSYLICRPSGWRINAKHLMSHFECGKDKIYKCLSTLSEMSLLSCTEIRQKGKFSSYHYKLHLSRNFPHAEKPETVAPYADLPCPEKPDAENPDAYKTKRILNKDHTYTHRAREEKNSPVDNFSLEQVMYPESEQYRKSVFLREQCLKDEKSKLKYEQLQVKGLDKTFVEVIDECVTHYATQVQPQLVSPQRLQSWLNRDERYFKTKEMNSKPRKWVEREDREANNHEITKREKEAMDRKKSEIEASPQFQNIVTKVTERFVPRDKMDEYNTDEVRVPRERPVALKELLISLRG